MLFWFFVCLFVVVCFPYLFILSAVLISTQVGLGFIFRWLENKISSFGVVRKYLSADMEVAVIKELFIFFYI